jgi:DNA-binding CsgD family transcriptional regulator
MPLTSRQVQVMELLSQGLSNKEIAGRLRVTEQAVKAGVSRLLAKYGVRNRASLLRLAIAERDSRISGEAGIVVFDTEGHALLMNRRGAELAGGFDPVRSLGEQNERFRVRDIETRRPLRPEETPVGRALAGETLVNARFLARMPGESEDRIIRTFVAPLTDSDGRATGAIALFWREPKSGT